MFEEPDEKDSGDATHDLRTDYHDTNDDGVSGGLDDDDNDDDDDDDDDDDPDQNDSGIFSCVKCANQQVVPSSFRGINALRRHVMRAHKGVDSEVGKKK